MLLVSFLILQVILNPTPRPFPKPTTDSGSVVIGSTPRSPYQPPASYQLPADRPMPTNQPPGGTPAPPPVAPTPETPRGRVCVSLAWDPVIDERLILYRLFVSKMSGQYALDHPAAEVPAIPKQVTDIPCQRLGIIAPGQYYVAVQSVGLQPEMNSTLSAELCLSLTRAGEAIHACQ
jgi:hypothetical protein